MTAGAAAEDQSNEADERETESQVTGREAEAGALNAAIDATQHGEVLVCGELAVGSDHPCTIST